MNEVLFDVGRTLGERRLCRDGDIRDDYQYACQWAAEFEAAFQANPDAGESYYMDIEAFTLRKAEEAGFAPAPSDGVVINM